jgi:serine/threonine protein phosphatase PrpC
MFRGNAFTSDTPLDRKSEELTMSSVSPPEALAISLASQCDRGRVREDNQGTVRHTSTLLGDLLIVADGVGSDAGGRRASQIAVDTILSCFEGMPQFLPPEIAVAEAITQANAAIVAEAARPDYRDSRMEITAVVALLHRDADHANAHIQAIIGRMGDSRAYLINNQKLTLLTRDDSAGGDLFDRNQITPQEGEAHPDAALLSRYLGEPFNVRLKMSDARLEVGDTLLLCSHGLWGYVSEQEIERELSDGTRPLEEASRALLDLALAAGGYDNVAIEIARLAQSADTAAGAGSAVGPRPEIPPQTKSVREFAPASDTSQPEWRAAPSAAELQPIVSWATPEPIVYGTRLSSVQLNAAASVQGKFLYTPGPGYVLPAGMHTLWVTFFAAGQEDNPALAEVSITVSKATPSLHWPNPGQMLPGVALGAAQLNASASVPGTFEYSPAVGELLADGTHTLSVTFVPEDKANYTTAQATVSVTVAKTVPNIEWASPNPIPCGTPLGAAQLNASASIPGTFEYSPAAGEVLSAGSHTLSAIFIPSDGTSYSRARAIVSLAVTRATPTIAWPTPEKVPYGTRLSDSQLNATASVPGTFVYTPGPGTLLSAGEHTPSVVFTPSNLSDYVPAQAAVSLSVIRETPKIHWLMPDPINRATPLGPAQLNASAFVPGSFTYSLAAGETLEPGTHALSVRFTPADSVNYTPAEASVSLTVAEISPASVTWLDPHSISYGTALSAEQLNASSSISGSFIYAPAAGEVLPAGKHELSVIFTPRDEQKHAKAQANVTLIVEELPNVASLLRATLQTPLDRGVTGYPVAADTGSATPTATKTQDEDGSPARKKWPIIGLAASGAALARNSKSSAGSKGFWKTFVRTEEPGIIRRDDQPAQNLQRETRLYRGAVYTKGDDGQWHLQRE